MKNTISTRLSGIRTWIFRKWETWLAAFLFSLLLFQCTLFMIQYTRIRNTKAEASFDMRTLSSTSTEISDSLNSNLLLPLSITVHASPQCATLLNSSPAIRDVYASLQEVFFHSLANEPSDISEADWVHAMQSTQFVYIRYASEIPYQLIYAFTPSAIEADMILREAAHSIGVTEILLPANAEDRFSRFFVRTQDRFFAFSVDDTSSFSVFQNYLLLYNEVFYASEISYADNTHTTTLTITEQVLAREILVSTSVSTLLMGNQSDLRSLLKLLNYNPDKLNSHTETDGTHVFVESHGVLRIDEKSLNYIASDGGGIDITSGDTADGATDIYACLRMMTQFLTQLSQMSQQYTGGDASLCLDSIYTDQSDLYITLHFRCENLPLMDADGNITLTFVFSSGKLIGIHWPMISAGRTLQSQHVMLQSWCQNFLAPDGALDSRLVYQVNSINLNTISAVWSILPSSASAEEDV